MKSFKEKCELKIRKGKFKDKENIELIVVWAYYSVIFLEGIYM